MPRIVRSSSALRFSLRASHSVPTAPCRVALSEAGKPGIDGSDDILEAASATMRTSVRHLSWPHQLASLVGLGDQRAAAILERPERLPCLDGRDDLEHVPFALGFCRRLYL